MPNLSQSIKERLSFLTVIFFKLYKLKVTKVILDFFFFFLLSLFERQIALSTWEEKQI